MKKMATVFLGMAVLFAGDCREKEPAPTDSGELKGTINISGAFALYPMAIKWAEEFKKINPGISIDVSAGGAGKGIADALSGIVDIGMVSREIHDAEIAKGAWWTAVTKDAVVPIFNRQNPLLLEIMKTGVQKETIQKIWLSGSEVSWEEIAGGKGKNLIHLYTRSDSCGAAETWALFLGKKQDDLLGIGVYGDPGLSEAVRKDLLGIGYNNINYAYDAGSKKVVDGLEILPIDFNRNGKIDPEENFYATRDELVQAITLGRYPSPPARDLYLVCKGKPQRKAVAAFIRWILTTGQEYVPETGYIGLSSEKLAKELKKIDSPF